MGSSPGRVLTAAAALVLLSALPGCGGGSRLDANEPSGTFPVAITSATFPPSQRISEHTRMVITVRNAGNKTIPNIAITVCNVTCQYPAPPGEGTSAGAFASNESTPYLANPSRPVWIVDHPPGLCGYSCKEGGPGGAVTAYTNTWALGALRPGATATFNWDVTPVKPGTYVLAWEIAAGLNGKAKAVLDGGGQPGGTFRVTIRKVPQKSYVTGSGQIVKVP